MQPSKLHVEGVRPRSLSKHTPPRPQFSHYLRDPTHTRAYTRFNAVYVFPNVGLRQLSPAVRLLIFQNQGFDRLSEFPKIREAIIVSADGWQRAGGFKTIEEGLHGLDSGSQISSVHMLFFFFSSPPHPSLPTSSKHRQSWDCFATWISWLNSCNISGFCADSKHVFCRPYYSCR